jgi:hypothetical protein
METQASRAASAGTPADPLSLLLARAAAVGDESECRRLIDLGAQPSGREHLGQTALKLALLGSHIDIARLLLSHNAALGDGDEVRRRSLAREPRARAHSIRGTCVGASTTTQLTRLPPPAHRRWTSLKLRCTQQRGTMQR